MRARQALALLFGLSLALTARAAVSPAYYQALHWRLIGPFRGGRVLAVSGIPGNSRVFYFGAVDGGVWETHDAGRTWQPIFDHEPVGSIGALAVAPSNPHIIYVGTGEADMRSDIAQGDGMFKSTDGGRTWTHIGLTDTRQIARIIVNPGNPDIVFVAALGHPYGPNTQRGVFRSTDGGLHWRKVLYRNANTGAVDVAFKPGDPRTIYAALWQTRRPPWSVYPPSNGPGSGLFVSHDGGNHWRQIRGHGFLAHPGRMGIAVAPSRPSRVYVLADGSRRAGGLYRSDDGGVHWSHVSNDRRIWQRGWYFCALTVDPKDADRIYVMNTIMLRSDDAGRRFIALKGDPTGDDFHQLWIDPLDTDQRILGVDQGALVTLDGGRTWSSWYNQPTAQIYHVATDNRFPYWVYGAQQDSGAVALPSQTGIGDGITMQEFHEVAAGGESGMIAPDPDNPHIVYGGTVSKLNLRNNQVRDVDPTLAEPALHYRSAWTLPLVFSRRDKKALYFANQRLYRTTDGGNHWAVISPDLTRPHPAIPPNLDAPTIADDDHVSQRRGVIYTISPSPLRAGLLWVGTDDGLVWRTMDGGAHWQQVTPPALTAWSKVAGIEPSHFDIGRAYLAVDRHRLDDDAPYIYRTTDGGATWTRIDTGIPRNDFVNVVREDPIRPGLLYAGTEHGVYVSFDDGGHWQSLQQNLPVTSVRDIDVHGDDLVIATHGRGFWIMDDISALRQMGAVRPGEVTLFRPAPAIRVRPLRFTGTPMPKDEPLAANPPYGAIVDYVLPRKATAPVTLTVLDAGGRVVRKFSSATHFPPPDPYKLDFAPEWLAHPTPLATSAGMHRFVWDLQYPPPPRMAGARPLPGVWAPPGLYTVRLVVDGKSYSQPLRVLPDPRVHVPQQALLRQFRLARNVEQKYRQAGETNRQAVRLLQALGARLAQAGALRGSMLAAQAEIIRLSGAQTHPNPDNTEGTFPRNTGSLRALLIDFGKLARAVDGADADPSQDARAAYAALSHTLDMTLEAWGRFRSGALARLNRQLASAGQSPLPD